MVEIVEGPVGCCLNPPLGLDALNLEEFPPTFLTFFTLFYFWIEQLGILVIGTQTWRGVQMQTRFPLKTSLRNGIGSVRATLLGYKTEDPTSTFSSTVTIIGG
jgi:hypothetical protein